MFFYAAEKNPASSPIKLFIQFIIFGALFYTQAFASQSDEKVTLPEHVSLFKESDINSIKIINNNKIKTEFVPVAGQTFKRALKITNKIKGKYSYSSQVNIKITSPVKKDDLIMVRCYARGKSQYNESGGANVRIYLQQSVKPWYKYFARTINAGEEWRDFSYTFIAEKSAKAGEVELCFGVGLDKQTIEIGDVEIIRFAPGVKKSDIPATPWVTPGSEANASWRNAAAERIEKYRKADLQIKVVDADGNPVPDAKVSVTMTKHQFKFASPYADDWLLSNSDDAVIYRKKLFTLFNQTGSESFLKWKGWQKTSIREKAIRSLKIASKNGMSIRGHVMVWQGNTLPESIRNLIGTDKQKEIPVLIEKHIRDIARATKPYICEWDVLNENFIKHDVVDIFGKKIMVEWFKTAREELENADLYINDFYILNGGGPGSKNHEIYKNTIKYLLDNGAPLNGIGFQSHIGSFMNHPQKVYEILDDFAKFGLKMKITEFDVDIDDEQAQAQYTKDFMTIVFSHPNVEGFQMWGFWEGRHWRPRAAMFRKNWTPKPNYFAYEDLVFKKWWTKEQGVTNNKGIFDCRGFLGEYVVQVVHSKNSVKEKLTLSQNGSSILVKIP
jgi:GH35 family endo-1,4-beta-xylanase